MPNQPKDDRKKPQPQRGKDSKPVKMSGMSNAAMEGQLGNAAAQDVGNTGSSGEGQAHFTNPDYNRQRNPDAVEGLEAQRQRLHEGSAASKRDRTNKHD